MEVVQLRSANRKHNIIGIKSCSYCSTLLTFCYIGSSSGARILWIGGPIEKEVWLPACPKRPLRPSLKHSYQAMWAMCLAYKDITAKTGWSRLEPPTLPLLMACQVGVFVHAMTFYIILHMHFTLLITFILLTACLCRCSSWIDVSSISFSLVCPKYKTFSCQFNW